MGMKTVSAISALCAIAIVAPDALGQDKPREREIRVVGRGSVSVTPDQLSFQIGVESNGPSVEAVRRDNDGKTNAMLKTLKEARVPEGDIVTTGSTLRKIFTPAEENKTKKASTIYTFNREMRVLLRKIDGAENVLGALLQAGANTLSELKFIDSKVAEHRDAAVVLAAADAIRGADFLAAQFGAKRGKVISISPEESTEVLQVLQKREADITTRSQPPEITSAAFSAGDMKVEATVTASFALE